MARQKTNKEIKSISFDKEVLRALEQRCFKEKIGISTFVNNIVQQAVLSEHEFYRRKAVYHASEVTKYQMLMDSSKDKPEDHIEKWVQR